MNDFPWLSAVVLAPWIGALTLALGPGLGRAASRAIGLLFSLSPLAAGLALLARFDPSATSYQFVENHAWIAAFNVRYHLGLDGLSLLLVLLTGVLGPLALLAPCRSDTNTRLFAALLLFLQGSALGVFLALDFFPWFVCWELSLVPAFFLIKLWGGADATRAAYQFFTYTMAGSALMLLAFAALYVATGTMDFVRLAELAADGTLRARVAAFGSVWPQAIFLGVLLGVAVKAPLFPFHTWLPPAYAEAPTGVSVFLSGVMSKMGVYGFFRLLWPIFPAELHAAAGPLLWLAVGGAVFGAFAALRQTDIKRMIAYSSVNHISYCLLALFAVATATGRNADDPGASTSALAGAVLQMFNHGLSAGALFLCAGVLEIRADGRRDFADFGGVRAAAPIFAGLCGIALFSSLGLPGLNGFIGEFLIFRGVFGLAPAAAAVSCLGLLATALCLLTFWQKVFHGPRAGAAEKSFRDLSAVEIGTLAPLGGLMLLFGVLPHLLTVLINPLVMSWALHATAP